MDLNILADGLVIAGACVLIGALIPVLQLIAQLLPGQVRRKWYIMTGLITFFIVGYLGYAKTIWSRQATWPDLIVPGVFFFGAVFVLLTATLSLQTATDVRRVATLERENISDPLIGIYNRRYLDRRLEEERALSQRYSLPLSVLLVDIDQFKSLNDKYGHQVGDIALSTLGMLLLQVIRDADIVARYGGDEIMIIAPNTFTPSAGVLAERIRRHVETHELVLEDTANMPGQIGITISVGVAGLSQNASDCHTLVQNADEALYRAKQEGRNRVVIYGASPSKAAPPTA